MRGEKRMEKYCNNNHKLIKGQQASTSELYVWLGGSENMGGNPMGCSVPQNTWDRSVLPTRAVPLVEDFLSAPKVIPCSCSIL